VRIIDGDTIEVSMNRRTYKLRYIGIDSPEQGRPGFQEAMEANRHLVEGQTVYLVKDVSETDRYGRLLRYVYLADRTFVNLELVRRGFAQAVSYPPDIKYQELFQKAQQEAMSANRGLWALIPKANVNANLRAGPGTVFPKVGGVPAGTPLNVVARNPAGDWYQLENGAWIFAKLVDNAPTVPVAAVIPTPPPPPTNTSAPPPPAQPTQPVAVCSCSGNIYNCSDFSSHAAAQACYEYCLKAVGYDIHRLDRDKDGVACESLP